MKPRVRPDDIIDAVAFWTGVPRDELMSRGRSKRITGARLIAFQAMRSIGLSYPEIGRTFGMDHSTVVYQCKKAPDAEVQNAILARAEVLRDRRSQDDEERANPIMVVSHNAQIGPYLSPGAFVHGSYGDD